MKRVGLTGGIGAGKTTVSRIFKLLGVPVFNSDEEAKLLLSSNEEVKQLVANRFGPKVYKDGDPDRELLASIVFNDKEALADLNGIIHPAVAKKFEAWLQKEKDNKLVLKEAAILFESGAGLGLDCVITVEAPVELRIERCLQRGDVSREQIEKRMKNQFSEDERVSRADYVIYNNESSMLIPQVLKIYKNICGEDSDS